MSVHGPSDPRRAKGWNRAASQGGRASLRADALSDGGPSSLLLLCNTNAMFLFLP